MNPSSEPKSLEIDQPFEKPLSISHLFRVLQHYSGVILASLAIAWLLFLALAVAAFLITPSQKVTSVQFRLDFEGASEGRYPNKLKFSPSEIVATPILLHVYNANQLKQYLPFDMFARSVVVLESNLEYEILSNQYRARLSDARLSAIDRDRLEKEFQQKLSSISKHGYAIEYVQAFGRRPPEVAIRKALTDILNRWAWVAVNDQHVLAVDATVLSPHIVDDPAIRSGNIVAGVQILRSRVWRVLQNVHELKALPGASMTRTADQISLDEVAIRLEELVRFRLEPLVASIRPSDLENPAGTLQFLRNQLAYDERMLQAAINRAEAVRQTLAVYSQEQQSRTASSETPPPTPASTTGETVMPQLSDTFLDRLVSLTANAGDRGYRQKLTDDYNRALSLIGPLQEAVAYDRQILAQIQAGGGSGTRDAQAARAELAAVQNELRGLVAKTNELYTLISQNLYPTSQLLTMTAPPVTRTARAISIMRLALYGALVLIVTLLLAVVGVLLHNRMREEESGEPLSPSTD